MFKINESAKTAENDKKNLRALIDFDERKLTISSVYFEKISIWLTKYLIAEYLFYNILKYK